MTAPDQITTLNPGEVFVFGSHESGHHAGGAARFAVEHFGAVVGQGEGLQGASYAIPTMGTSSEVLTAVERFIGFARLAPGIKFLVTPVGTGIAGRSVTYMADLFRGAPNNVELPAVFAVSLRASYVEYLSDFDPTPEHSEGGWASPLDFDGWWVA